MSQDAHELTLLRDSCAWRLSLGATVKLMLLLLTQHRLLLECYA